MYWAELDVADVATLLAEESVARDLLKQSAFPPLPESLQTAGANAVSAAQDFAGRASSKLQDFAGRVSPKLQELGGRAADWLQEPGQQGLRYAATGAGIGGLLGLGSSLRQRKEDRQPLSSLLTGALAGGAIGGGAGLAHQALQSGLLSGSKDLADVNRKIEDAKVKTPSADPNLLQSPNDPFWYRKLRSAVGLGDKTPGRPGSPRPVAEENLPDAKPSVAARGLGAGLAGAGTVGLANLATVNSPRARIIRGIDQMLELPAGKAKTDYATTLRNLQASSGDAPLGKAYASAVWEKLKSVPGPRGPRPDVSPPVPSDPHLLGIPKPPSPPSVPTNKYMPELTNAEVRNLARRGWKVPGKAWGTAGAASLIAPFISAYLQDANVQSQQQQYINSLLNSSGGG